MINIGYFSKSTRKMILFASVQSLPDGWIERNMPEPDAIHAEVDSQNYYLAANDIVTKIPESPGNFFIFDAVSGSWVSSDSEILAKRRAMLAASDWTQLPDVPAATRDAWAPYRQQLRDITDQPGYPTNISWPVPPA